jgi:hypothetical protein
VGGLIGGLLLLTAYTSTAHSAKIAVQSKAQVRPGLEIPVISVFGKFEPGDGDRFLMLTAEIRDAIILFDSPGGALMDAIKMGERIYTRQYTTIAVADCASACAVAWLGGAYKSITGNARVGFHAAWSAATGQISSSGNAVLGAYLSKVGLSTKAIAIVTNPPPSSILWLTPEVANYLGISIARARH